VQFRALGAAHVVAVLAIVFLAAYFFYHWSDSLRAEFTADDLMNCHRAYFRPWSALVVDNLLFFRPTPVYRPFPALAYKAFFTAWGFDLWAFRLFVLAVAAMNVYLVGLVAYRLTGWREAGLISALLFAWHEQYAPLLYNTGQIYDAFCFLFYFAALVWSSGGREETQGARRLVVVVVLLVLALNSKEMAVSLPVMILLWDLWVRPRDGGLARSMRFWFRQGRTAFVTAAVVLLFLLGRMRGPESLSQVAAYRPEISVANYFTSAGYYLGEAIYHKLKLGPGLAAAVLCALLASAVAMRSRALIWSWALFTIGILPLAFIPHRGLAAAVIPYAGLVIYVAVLLAGGRSRLLEAAGLQGARMQLCSQVAVFVAAAALVLQAHGRAWSFRQALSEHEYSPIRTVREQLRALYPSLAPATRLLFVSDPFGNTYDIVFLVHLAYRNSKIEVHQLWRLKPAPDFASYDYVVEWCDGRFVELMRR
jgi:hypothetical protein